MEELILVDLDDKQIGTGEKLQVHRDGKLHRAFSVFVLHGEKMLLQQRNLQKYHCGGLWANACCSHPRNGEALEDAVKRRLYEETGIECPAEELFSFVYRSTFENGLTEYEFDHVFLAEYAGEAYPNPEEIAALRWVTFAELKQELLEKPEQFTPWFITAAPRVMELLENRK